MIMDMICLKLQMMFVNSRNDVEYQKQRNKIRYRTLLDRRTYAASTAPITRGRDLGPYLQDVL